MSITYSECVFAILVIQRAKRMPFVILLSMTCPAVPHFFSISLITRFSEKNMFNKNAFWFSLQPRLKHFSF